ncbi:type II toxin-antitoxin system RelE/ParE family toxin [bacterium]|nr:type II toxin-antitoxin system RelE/ParE family toxin [bacterium]
MNYYFHEKAEFEFIKAVDYYEKCETGLGLRFSEEVYSTIKRACCFPFAWEKIDFQTHRCLTDKFPYGILYRVLDDHIRVMAIMHLHRMPDYWRKRK